jgi:hypothetical protein
MSALAYALQLLASLPQLIQAGVDVMDTINAAKEKLQTMSDEGRDPTPAEWDELNERIRGLRSQLHSGGSDAT